MARSYAATSRGWCRGAESGVAIIAQARCRRAVGRRGRGACKCHKIFEGY